jgi:hypothetical protein
VLLTAVLTVVSVQGRRVPASDECGWAGCDDHQVDKDWQDEATAFNKRSLADTDYVYL